MEKGVRAPETFDNAQQEIDALRAELERREQELREAGAPAPREELAHAVVADARAAVPAEVHREVREEEGIVLHLAPEFHDGKMAELIHLLQEKGLSYALASAEATRSPHLIDDFHRILVQYVKEGYPGKGLAKKPLGEALRMRLYEVFLPDAPEEEGKDKQLKEILSSMEQFYQGMASVSKSGGHFTLEMARPSGSPTTSFFLSVPGEVAELFEKQILGVFPTARIEPAPDDYNIFPENGFAAASRGVLARYPIYALKTYDEFDYDPLNILLNAFSKLSGGEGAAVQFSICLDDRGYLDRFQSALQNIYQGYPIEQMVRINTGGWARTFTALKKFISPPKKKEERTQHIDKDPRVKNIEKKVRSPIGEVNVRVLAAAGDPVRAGALLRDIESAFGQFSDTNGNAILFEALPSRKLRSFIRDFSYRLFTRAEALLLSTGELATLAHLPASLIKTAPELKRAKAALAPAPPGLPQEGTLLGVNRFRNEEKKIYITPDDRLRHFYCIGQTGTGKSTLLKNMVIQDIKSGAGVCMIDPHGVDVLEVLSAVPPEREGDVIYFDPAAMQYPMGLNMLEYDPRYPEQKTLVVDELLGIFRKLFGEVPESMGPAFEQYFRNTALLVMEDPASGSTLLDMVRIFTDATFRNAKIAKARNPLVIDFWKGIAEKATGEMGLQNYAPYITNKFDVFLANEFVRPIIAQQTSSFNFRDIMDGKKIFLANLAKGRIGDANANLLGLVIVGKILIAALSRADSAGKDLPPFYLHIDEFQNFTTNSIATILSEARKYKLSLTVAHQFIKQLSEEIKDAVFGNIGSLCAFRVGPEDAEFLEKQFAPVFMATDIMNIDNRSAYLRLLARGRPEKPFSLETLPFSPGSLATIDRLKELSYIKYGRPRADVEREVLARYTRA